MQGGQLAHAGDARHEAAPDELERPADLHLLDILGDVAAGQALVDVLVAGQRGELLDARLDVVAGRALTCRNRLQVDGAQDALIVLDDTVRYVDPEVSLGPQNRQPQLAFGDHLARRRPDVLQLG